MPGQADGSAKVSEQQLSEIAGITASLRQTWANKGRLRKGGRGGYREDDAVELSALKAIMDSLGPSDAPIAWKQVRDAVEERQREGHLVLIFDRQDKTAGLAATLPQIEQLVAPGRKTSLVLLSEPIMRVRRAFALLTDDS